MERARAPSRFHAAVYVESMLARVAGKLSAKTAKKLAEYHALQIYNHCDLTITPSRALQGKLQALGAKRVVYLPLGVDLNLFQPSKRDHQIRRQLGMADDELLLIFAGRLDSEKQAETLVAAFERLPTTFKGALAIIGDGPLRTKINVRARQNSRLVFFPLS